VNLPALALRHRPFVVACVTILVTWGTICFLTMPRREDPEFNIRTCMITTRWPGATVENVEKLVTEPLERRISSIKEVEKVYSVTTVGQSVIYVDLQDRVTDANQYWSKVRAKVDQVRPTLPNGCLEPYVDDDFCDTAAMILAIYEKAAGRQPGPRYAPREMEEFAKKLRDQIQLLPACSRVDLGGVHREAIYLEVDPGTWSQLTLTTDTLRRLLEARNIVAPGGTIDTELNRFAVQPTGELESVEQIDRIVVAEDARIGATVYLGDLGVQISRRYEEPPRMLARYGGPGMDSSVPCIVLAVFMKPGEKVTDFGDDIRATVANAKQTVLPPDVDVAVTGDPPTLVRRKIGDFFINLVSAAVIVILSAYLLIGLRIALIMATSIPFVLVSAIGISRLFGVELEQVSIASLIIALGMLVDNTIEVCDNILRLLEEGYSRLEAAREGARQIAFPVLMATLTTVAAFLPLAFALQGSIREYLFSLSATVSITLLVSWCFAMTMTVVMAYWMLRRQTSKGPLLLLVDVAGNWLRRGDKTENKNGRGLFAAVSAWCLRWRVLVFSSAVVLFVLACMLIASGLISTDFFPDADRSQFVVDIFLPEGSSIEATSDVARRVEQIVVELGSRERGGRTGKRLSSYVVHIGGGAPRFYLGLRPNFPASNYATMVVNTTRVDVTEQYAAEVRRAAAEQIAGARVIPKMLTMGTPVEAPIQLRIMGSKFADLDGMRHYAEKLREIVRNTPGTWDVHDQWGTHGYQLAVQVDEDRANRAGVTNAAIARTLNAYFSGHYLTTFNEGDRKIPVYLRLPPGRRSLREIDTLYVEGTHGKVPIDAVAQVEPRLQPAKLGRYKLVRMIDVRARVEPGHLPDAVVRKILPKARALEATMPAGWRIEVGGTTYESRKGRKQVAFSFVISLLLIVFCLMLQFNSVAKTAVILVTLPLAATGGLVGLYLTGMPLGFMAQVGMLSLAGIVLNDAIVLIEFVEMTIREQLQQQQGPAPPDERSCCGLSRESFRQCVLRGTRLRILPIMLTTITTVGGMLPLAFAGGPLFEPMAVVIIFGLLLATVLTLFVVPALYVILVEDLRLNMVKH
jgi:multidrug efflux pump subunit AcrB